MNRITTKSAYALAVMIIAVIGMAHPVLAGEIKYTLDLSGTELTIDSIVAPDGNTYTRIYTVDCDFIGKPGEPMIPAKIINFLVPTYSNDFSISICSYTTIGSNTISSPLIPVQEDQLASEYDPMKFTSPICATESESSQQGAEIVNELFVNGDSHVVSVAVPMINYNYNTLVIDRLSNLEVKLEYSVCDASQMYLRPISGPASVLDMSLDGFVVNSPPIKAKSSKVISTDNNSRYLILTPQSLKESVTELARWKTQRGHKVIIRTVEEIMASNAYDFVDSTSAVDKESKIRNWLKYEVKQGGAFQLLIVGDYRTSAPIRKFNMGRYRPLDHVMSKYDSEGFTPTDGYFSDLNSPFPLTELEDGNKYVDFDNLSTTEQTFSPTLPVGRLLASKQSDIDNYLRKLLIYQIDPGLGDSKYLNRNLLVKQYDLYKATLKIDGTGSLFDKIESDNTIIQLIDSIGGKVYETNFPTGKDVIDNLRLCGIASLMGHGIPSSISCAGKHETGNDNSLYKEDRYIMALPSSPIRKWGYIHFEDGNTFADLKNYGKPSIIYTGACESTPFDNILCGFGYIDADYVMGDAYTCAGDFGGVAYIGYTRSEYISTNISTECSFGQSLNKNHNIGLALSNDNKYSSYYGYNINKYTRNLIGDPDIDVWTSSPLMSKFDVRADLPYVILDGDLLSSTVAFYDGNQNSSSVIFSQDFQPKNISLRVPEYITSRQKDFAISIFKDSELPTIRLFASDSKLKNTARYYFLREGSVMRLNGTYGFILQDKGRLNLTCTRSLVTDRSFKIESGGIVNVKCFGNVKFKEDVVNAGGKIIVNAAETTLERGFSIEKGGELSITMHKWNGHEPSE